MLCFVAFSLLAGVVAGDLAARVRDVMYFTGSGFLLYFLVVSGDMTTRFATRSTRLVALTAVAVSILGILEIVVNAHMGPAADGTPRIASTLGSPVVLAAYLVLGRPLGLAPLTCAQRRGGRGLSPVSTTLGGVA